jgi:uncharacterized membrane protein YphA (DoxX/SURF4 family)
MGAFLLRTMAALLLLQHGTIAFILSGLTAVAYFDAHAPQGFFPILNGGELAALYVFVFLLLAAVAGGPWSADGLLRKDEAEREPAAARV